MRPDIFVLDVSAFRWQGNVRKIFPLKKSVFISVEKPIVVKAPKSDIVNYWFVAYENQFCIITEHETRGEHKADKVEGLH